MVLVWSSGRKTDVCFSKTLSWRKKFRRERDDRYLFRSSLFADIKLSFFHPLLKLKDVLVIIAPVRLRTSGVDNIRSQQPQCKRAHRSPVGRAHHARGEMETLRSLHFKETCRHGGHGFQVSQRDVRIITQIWLIGAGDLSIKTRRWDGLSHQWLGLGWCPSHWCKHWCKEQPTSKRLFCMDEQLKTSSTFSLDKVSRKWRTCCFLLKVPTLADITGLSATQITVHQISVLELWPRLNEPDQSRAVRQILSTWTFWCFQMFLFPFLVFRDRRLGGSLESVLVITVFCRACSHNPRHLCPVIGLVFWIERHCPG